MSTAPSSRTTHGHARRGSWSTEYQAWINMRKRCGDANNKRYGGRGIKVCARWSCFENFLADMGCCPPGLTLERRDSDRDYMPDNCRWATPQEQANNTSRNVLLCVGGISRTISGWATATGINRKTITKRLQLGWALDAAITTPVRTKQ